MLRAPVVDFVLEGSPVEVRAGGAARRARLDRLPGGGRRQKATLDWLLAWIHAARPTAPSLREALDQRFDASGRCAGDACLRLLEGSGLVQRAEVGLELTPAGVAYCGHPDPAALFEQLRGRYVGLLETLALASVPRLSGAQRDRILTALLGKTWRTSAQVAIRRSWLRSLGLLDAVRGGEVLTPLGRRVLEAHPEEVTEICKRAEDLLAEEREADVARAEALAWAAMEAEGEGDADTETDTDADTDTDAGTDADTDAGADAGTDMGPPRWLSPHVDLADECIPPYVSSLDLPVELIPRICAALSSGKHLLLAGPPGTGKTELALALGRAAEAQGYCRGVLSATASADWTTFETVGGYALQRDGALRFRPGVFLAALERRAWLLLDELNRADVDRALGELMTVLAGRGTTTPFQRDDGRLVSIGPDLECTHRVPGAFRLLATMNTWDKTSLFRLSYAVQRRFAIVHVGVPDDERYGRLLARHAAQEGADPPLDPRVLAAMGRLFRSAGLLSLRAVGPAIAIDMVRYLRRRGDPAESLAEAAGMFLLPQLEGLDGEAAVEACRRVAGALAGVASRSALAELAARFAESFPHLRLPAP